MQMFIAIILTHLSCTNNQSDGVLYICKAEDLMSNDAEMKRKHSLLLSFLELNHNEILNDCRLNLFLNQEIISHHIICLKLNSFLIFEYESVSPHRHYHI